MRATQPQTPAPADAGLHLGLCPEAPGGWGGSSGGWRWGGEGAGTEEAKLHTKNARVPLPVIC